MKRWQTFSYDQLRAFISTLDNAERNGGSQFLCSGFEYCLDCRYGCPLWEECNSIGVPYMTLEEWKDWGQEEV